MSKVTAEWIDGELGGSLQKAYDLSESGDILTNSEKGSVDLRGGETGPGQNILTIGYTGKAPSTAFSGRSAIVATSEATLDDIQAGAIIGGHEGTMNEYSHGSVTLGGSFTEITDVSQNSSIQSSSYAKLKKAFHSSVIASAAYKDNIPRTTYNLERYLGSKAAGFVFGYSGMAEIRGTPEMFHDNLNIGGYPSVDGDKVLLGRYNITPWPVTTNKVGELSNVSEFFPSAEYAGTVLRKSANELLLVSNSNLYVYDETTGEEEIILSRGENSFSEGGSSLGVNYHETAGIQDIKVDIDGNILLVLGIYESTTWYVRVVRVDPNTKTLHTFAGTGTAGFSGDGGLATSAEISSSISGIAIHDTTGDVYISDKNNRRIRKVAYGTGIITTFAGTGVPGNTGDGGPAISADIDPSSMTVNSTGTYLYFLSGNQLRKVLFSSGVISTVYTGTTYHRILPWNQNGYDFILFIDGSSSGNILTLFSESFGNPLLITETLLQPPYSITSKYATLVGTSDSYMDMVENSGIVSSSSTCITAYHQDKVPSRNASIDSSAAVVVNDASCSKVSASSSVYMGAINKADPDPYTRSKSFVRHCEVIASDEVEVMDSCKVLVGGSATISLLKGDQSSVISSNGVTGINLVQSSIIASQDVNAGRVSPDVYLKEEEVGHSMIMATSEVDVYMMWYSILSASNELALENIVGTQVSACNRIIGESLWKSVVFSSDLSQVSSNTQTSVLSVSVCDILDNNAVSVHSAYNCKVQGNANSVVLALSGVSSAFQGEYPSTPVAIDPCEVLENNKSAILASSNSDMIKTTESLLAASTDSGLGVPAPTGSTHALRYSEAFEGSSEVANDIGGWPLPAVTGAHSSTLLSSQNSEMIKTVAGVVIGGERHSSQYNQDSVLLGGLESTNIYSDRMALLGGYKVAVGPFSHDSLIGGNTVSTFKETKVSALMATSDSLVRETENAMVSASTEVTALGLDKSGVILSSTVEMSDSLWSTILGSNFTQVRNGTRMGVLFSEEVLVEGECDSILVSATVTAEVSGSSRASVLASQDTILINGWATAQIAAVNSSTEDTKQTLQGASVDSSISNAEQAFQASSAQAIIGGETGTYMASQVSSVGVSIINSSFATQQGSLNSNITNAMMSGQVHSQESSILRSKNCHQVTAQESSMEDVLYASQVSSLSSNIFGNGNTTSGHSQVSVSNSDIGFGSWSSQEQTHDCVGLLNNWSSQKDSIGSTMSSSNISTQVAVQGNTLTGSSHTIQECSMGCTGLNMKESLQAASQGSAMAYADKSAQIATMAMQMVTGIQAVQESSYLGSLTNSRQATQTATHTSQVNTVEQSIQAGTIEGTFDTSSDSAQIAGRFVSLGGSYQSAQVASNGSTGLSLYSSFMAAGIESTFEGCTGSAQTASYTNKMTSSKTSAQIAASDSSMTLATNSAQIGVQGCTGLNLKNSATMASQSSTVYSCTGVSLIASKDSLLENSEQSAIVAALGAHVTGCAYSAVMGGIGGMATLPGQVTQGAGMVDGEEAGLFQSSKVLYSGICALEEEKKLTVQNLAGNHLIFDEDSTYALKVRIAAKAATGTVGLVAMYEGSVSVDSAGTEVYEDITLQGSYGNTLAGILDGGNVLVGVTGTSGRELHLLVKGATGVATTRWTAEVEYMKVGNTLS